MNDSSHRSLVNFQAKVLVPVILVMAMLVALTVWLVNRRIVHQLERDAAQRVSTAAAVFQNLQKIRANNLLLLYCNVPNDPRFKAVSQLADPKTMRALLIEILDEFKADLVTFTTVDGRRLAGTTRAPSLDLAEFEANGTASIRRALEGQANATVTCTGDRLFDIVSVPVRVGKNIVGALTFGAEIGNAVAQDFRGLTHGEVAFMARDHLVATTLDAAALRERLDQMLPAPFPSSGGDRAGAADVAGEVEIGGEHFVYWAGIFGIANKQRGPGYLLFCSYEQPLQALHTTQRILVGVGIGGIGLGSMIVWLLVRKITQPLRLLRDSAEAVGRGDFTQRVSVHARDECGQLADAFNRMTENLKASHEQLEHTVESLKSTKAQLTRTEKLSAVGEFVAGVTHELNNPLTSVIGFAELLGRTNPTERQRTYLSRIVSEAHRCHKIVHSLLSFARQQPPQYKLLNLNAVVEAAADILRYQCRTSNIDLVTRLDPRLPAVKADAHQLQQVFVNIINNARQAVESYQPHGALEITTEALAGKVRVSFKDNGPGISKENLAKLFTPFFTTKEVGKGTGLGLSLCYGIVQKHGGTISVQSQLGAGTTFIVELPAADDDADTTPSDETARVSEPAPATGNGKRVLVVDDEHAVCELLREALSAGNYEVETADDGEAALQQLAQARYDVIVCDMKMPGLNGQQVYEELCARDPEAAKRFVFMTGNVVGEAAKEFLDQAGRICLSKPFSLDEFSTTIGSVCDVAR